MIRRPADDYSPALLVNAKSGEKPLSVRSCWDLGAIHQGRSALEAPEPFTGPTIYRCVGDVFVLAHALVFAFVAVRRQRPHHWLKRPESR